MLWFDCKLTVQQRSQTLLTLTFGIILYVNIQASLCSTFRCVLGVCPAEIWILIGQKMFDFFSSYNSSFESCNKLTG